MKLGSTRRAIHDALTWGYQQKGELGIVEWLKYLTKIEKSFRQDEWRTADFLEAGWILAAINCLRPEVGAWLRYCYGVDNYESDLQIVATFLFMANFLGRKKIDRYQALCKCAVDDYRSRIRIVKSMPAEAYVHAMQVNASHFARDWKDPKNLCLDQLKSIDSEGIARVSMMVKYLRGERPDGRENETLTDILEEIENS